MSGSPSISRPLRQQGVSLVVVLILLLIMTLLDQQSCGALSLKSA